MSERNLSLREKLRFFLFGRCCFCSNRLFKGMKRPNLTRVGQARCQDCGSNFMFGIPPWDPKLTAVVGDTDRIRRARFYRRLLWLVMCLPVVVLIYCLIVDHLILKH